MQYLNAMFAKRVAHGLRCRILGEKHVVAFYRTRSFLKRRSDLDIWFFPQCPDGMNYSIEKVCAELGIKMVPDRTARTTLGFVQEDATINQQFIANGIRLLNARCTNISKVYVERIFEDVFGYPLAVDPTTYRGIGVCKSNTNAIHDGRIIELPVLQGEPEKVYELLIDNSVDGGAVEDIRISVVGNKLPLAYLKRRWAYMRFHNANFAVTVVDVEAVTTEIERNLIVKFAQAMGLDFGELDVLRDRASGKIYIVDVAKTPFGPPTRLAFGPKTKAVKKIAQAFQKEFLSSENPSFVSSQGLNDDEDY